MGFGKVKGPKDPYEELDSDFKDAVVSMSVDDINKRISEVAKAEQENIAAKAADLDLQNLQETAKDLAAPYDTLTKQHKLLLRAFSSTLKDKGIEAGTAADLNRRIAEVAKAEEENQKHKADDSALASAKDEVASAAGTYKDATKMNRLRVRYCMRVLSDKGAA